jgi:hypothetical protein
MSGLGKQFKGTGIAKVQHQSTPFKEGGRACYVQGGGAKVGDVKVKIPPYLRKGMIKMGLKKGGSANWIKGAIKKPGALRKSLGVKAGEKIPASKLEAAAKKPGKLGRRARFAQTLKGLKK